MPFPLFSSRRHVQGSEHAVWIPVRAHLDGDEGADKNRMAGANAAARKQIHRLAWEYMRKAALQDGAGNLARYKDMLLFVVVPEVGDRTSLLDIDERSDVVLQRMYVTYRPDIDVNFVGGPKTTARIEHDLNGDEVMFTASGKPKPCIRDFF
jgi:hypothetical protein